MNRCTECGKPLVKGRFILHARDGYDICARCYKVQLDRHRARTLPPRLPWPLVSTMGNNN
jgi:hypothetical protein